MATGYWVGLSGLLFLSNLFLSSPLTNFVAGLLECLLAPLAKRGNRRAKGGKKERVWGKREKKKKKERTEKKSQQKQEKYLFWMAVCLHPHPHLTSMIPNGQTLKEESEMIAHTWRMGRLWKGLGERVADAAVGYTYFGLLIN